MAEHYPARRDRLVTYWRAVHQHTRARYQHWRRRPWLQQPWLGEALCVHHYEGAWDSETGNGYHGGLQFDQSFEQTYGPTSYARWGDAGHWPPADQLHAAYRAWRIRGWTPWPNTARTCGLL